MAADEAEALLRETKTADLLKAAYALTHRIHSEQDHGAVSESHASAKREHLADLRVQRNRIEAEILRREREARLLLSYARPPGLSAKGTVRWSRRRTTLVRLLGGAR